MRDNPVLAGVFLGLAIGCRITSIAMLIPLTLMQIHQDGRFVHQRILVLYFISIVIAATAFLPVFSVYGLDFFTYYEGEYPDLLKLVYKMSIGVWGSIGALVVLMTALLIFMENSWKQKACKKSKDFYLILSWITVILIHLIMYLKLPYESGYLIPVVPFAFLLLNRLLDEKKLVYAFVLLISSAFMLTIDKSGVSLYGPIVNDYMERKRTVDFIEKVTTSDKEHDEPTIIISGYYLEMIDTFLFYESEPVYSVFVYVLNSEDIEEYISSGYRIYYLPKMREYNTFVTGVDLRDYGVIEWQDN